MGVTNRFVDGETIKLDKALTFISTTSSNSTTINADTNSATLLVSNATETGFFNY